MFNHIVGVDMAEETETISVGGDSKLKKLSSVKCKFAIGVGCALVTMGIAAGIAVAMQVPQAVGDMSQEEAREGGQAAKANAAANQNMDDAAKADAEVKVAEGEAAADQPAKAAAASGSGPGGGNSSGSSSGASSALSRPAHTHTWVAVTSQQWHSDPVSVWVQDSAAWDEVVNKGEKVVFSDGYVIYNPTNEQVFAYAKANRVSYGVYPYSEKVHHEAAGHYETQDQGWYETITTGYQCSGCGAWQ